MESLPYAVWGHSTFSMSLVEKFPTFRASYMFVEFSTKLKYGACCIKKILLKVLKYTVFFYFPPKSFSLDLCCCLFAT